ncbi:alpha-galactosidase [Rhodobacter sp. KR11]|uniref:alpha-galactosidase n=1 Tax=Rhodobacter sp. KR11 TaxID=2974588 RepID=UPI002222B27A|nr:alpha-galactosidase [Rhodobacter sp. KR11]MCW1919810.1 alpha-galactosidase [Rhodobacter sp. KR11]
MTQYRIDDAHSTLVLEETASLPRIAYFGPRLPDGEDLGQFLLSTALDLNGGMLDELAPLTLCPVGDGHFMGQPGLVIAGLVPRFRAHVAASGAELTVTARDEALGITYRAEIALDGVLALQAVVESDAPIRLEWLCAPVLPVAPGQDEIVEFSGRWVGELHQHRHRFAPGARLREARQGRSGQENPPFALTCTPGASATRGEVTSYAYGWPGGHRMLAEELPCGRRQVQFGHVHGSNGMGTRFETGVLTVARSGAGFNDAAVVLQAHVRDRLVPWVRPNRPVHYNCWEAVYFQHDLPTLSDMADRAARIGAERFVLDDGWFKGRNNDKSSLGDWSIDRQKWPHGLKPLIDKVKSLGMTFGLWVEPEMVNPDSDLYRAHPDWALGRADQVTGRYQLVLDLGRQEVRDYLFAAISKVLAENDIDYLKWDHNRLLPVLDAAQGRGVMDLMARLREAHPGVEIESCASGGGRIDYGILTQTTRVWLSDCIDALERVRMQATASLFLPAAVVGSHVGAFHAHTTGRNLPMELRAWVAAMRHMGFESDLTAFTPAEEALLTEVTAWYKANRDWMHAGEIRQLESEPGRTGEIQIAKDGARFVAFAVQTDMPEAQLPLPLRLTGLEPTARYRVTLRNPGTAPGPSRGPVALKTQSLTLSGQALMAQGLALPLSWPATLYVIEGTRL